MPPPTSTYVVSKGKPKVALIPEVLISSMTENVFNYELNSSTASLRNRF